jgi:sugar O-acyltransferase (sialic acid O-acetyltransferase NeuD family)
MDMDTIILIGAGSLSRDLVDCFGAGAFVGTYVDPQFPAASIRGLPVLSNWEDVCDIASHYMLGISDVAHRERASFVARQAGLLPAPPLVSRLAVVAADAVLAPGCAVGHMAVIGPSARLGENTLVMHQAIVAHDVVVGTNSVLCAGVSLGGHVHIGANTFIGSNAVLVPKLKIGAGTHIAAGAACFRDAEPGSTWIGNPARRTVLRN